MNNILIREMNKEDINEVLIVERSSFSTPWTEESFIQEITENKLAKYIVAIVDGKIVGYGGMWLILDEAHITNIAVLDDYRNQGIGGKLIDKLTDISNENYIGQMTLEVRKSNYAAIKLYENKGFKNVGIRPKYYVDSNEDAIIMWKDI